MTSVRYHLEILGGGVYFIREYTKLIKVTCILIGEGTGSILGELADQLPDAFLAG
jgi:hypothetical protein